MKISRIKLFRYKIPFWNSITLAKTTLNSREGLVIQITDQNGNSGIGEIAPLPGFSRESLDEAESELKKICSTNSYASVDTLQKSANGTLPSVCFGIECALTELRAIHNNITVPRVFSDLSNEYVYVNGLLAGNETEILDKAKSYSKSGYKAVKLKVGSGDLEHDIALTKKVRDTIGDDISLRLDSNRRWSISDAEKFCNAISDCHIEYLEEPLSNPKQIAEFIHKQASPVALDETTREIAPEQLEQYKHLKAVVLKPSMLGLSRTLKFVREAHQNNITPVIGSSFESGLALCFLAKLAAAVNKKDIACGLDTYSWFADDIIEGSLPVKNGKIDINNLPGSETVLKSGLLKEVVF